jgi:hypothetical protein
MLSDFLREPVAVELIIVWERGGKQSGIAPRRHWLREWLLPPLATIKFLKTSNRPTPYHGELLNFSS